MQKHAEMSPVTITDNLQKIQECEGISAQLVRHQDLTVLYDMVM